VSSLSAGSGRSALEADSPDFLDLVPETARLEQIASGLLFGEGPSWHQQGGFLVFSDIKANTIMSWSPERGLSAWAHPSNFSNGLAYDPGSATIVACQHYPSAIARYSSSGELRVLVREFEGGELNSPNDVVVKSDGAIYFTDPAAGRTAEFGADRPRELPFQGVFRFDPVTAALQLLVDDFELPNGLCFSPDEARLYVNDSQRLCIRVFDVDERGRAQNGRNFFAGMGTDMNLHGGPDGMKTDEFGNVYCAAAGGVWVIRPDGERLGLIRSEEFITNLAWGGPERRTLYLTGVHTLYRLETSVRGALISSKGAPDPS
jgi:gluconolactonase